MNCPRCGGPCGPYDPWCPRCGQSFAPVSSSGRAGGARYGEPAGQSRPASQMGGAGRTRRPGRSVPTDDLGSEWGASQPAAGWGYAPTEAGTPVGPYSRQVPPAPGYAADPADGFGWSGQAPPPRNWNAGPTRGGLPARAARTRRRRSARVNILVTAVIVLAGIGGIYLTQMKNPNSSILPHITSGGPSGTFSDALTTPSSRWPSDAHCRFGTGGYLVTDNYYCLPNTQIFSGANVKVSAKLVSGPSDAAFGLVLRSTDGQNYYVFHIFADGRWDFARPTTTTFEHIITPTASDAIKRGLNVTNTLEADMTGTHFVFLINGVKVGEATDPTYASGQVGIDSEDGVTVMYNDFVITQP